MKKNKLSENKTIESEVNKTGQTHKMKEEIGEIEDATKYGEFISSFFAWTGIEEQKQIVNELEKKTKK